MATYEETLNVLFRLKANRSENCVGDVRTICEVLGNPQNAFRIVHITGTNGKGTVSRQTAAILTAQGHKTGLITSPHIISFRERISVDFEQISEEYIQEKFRFITETFAEKGLSYTFEQVVFILGLLYLRDCQVEYAVIEVGCGGTRDSSNIVDPIVSVITSVGLDHQHMLGDTIEEIAIEKAGVFKNGRFCVIGPNTPTELLLKIAEEKGAIPLVVSSSQNDESFTEENSRITRRIFDAIEVRPDALEEGLKSRLPYRCHLVKCIGKDVILDVGHNGMALQRVFTDIKRQYSKDIRVCLAISKGRDPDEFIRIAFEHCKFVHAVTTDHMRILSNSVLEDSAKNIGKVLEESGDISGVLTIALEKVQDEILLIIGSCFIMEAAINILSPLGADFS